MDLPPPAAAIRPIFRLTRPAAQTAPLVFVSAHSGQDYPPEFLAGARLDPMALRRSEDGFVDELFAAAPALGAPLLAATFPRAYCDVNREKWELDPAMFEEPLPAWVNSGSARVAAGLGTIARIVASGEAIYRDRMPFTEAVVRMETYWQPFHDALGALVTETRERFGACLLIDCHSMPSGGASAAARPDADIVLGDAHGTACAAPLVRMIEQALGGLRYAVRRNDPYAGGYITRHYGRPRESVHALQIEIARSLYMDETRLERIPGFARVRSDMEALTRTLMAGTAAQLATKKMAAP